MCIIFAPIGSNPSENVVFLLYFALDRTVSVRFSPDKSTSDKSESDKSAPDKSDPEKLHFVKFESEKSIFVDVYGINQHRINPCPTDIFL